MFLGSRRPHSAEGPACPGRPRVRYREAPAAACTHPGERSACQRGVRVNGGQECARWSARRHCCCSSCFPPRTAAHPARDARTAAALLHAHTARRASVTSTHTNCRGGGRRVTGTLTACPPPPASVNNDEGQQRIPQQSLSGWRRGVGAESLPSTHHPRLPHHLQPPPALTPQPGKLSSL